MSRETVLALLDAVSVAVGRNSVRMDMGDFQIAGESLRELRAQIEALLAERDGSNIDLVNHWPVRHEDASGDPFWYRSEIAEELDAAERATEPTP